MPNLIHRLQNAGYTQDDIAAWQLRTKTKLLNAGYSEKEVNKYFGISDYTEKSMREAMQEYISQDEPDSFWDKFLKAFEPPWAERRARSYRALVGAEKAGVSPSKFEPTLKEAFQQGAQQSVTGLIYRGKAPDKIISAQAMKYLPTKQRIAMQTATVGGDLPFMIAGGVIGGVSGGPAAPLTAMGGAFALPAGLRKVYMDKYEKGEIQSFSEFWQRMGDAVMETLKGEAVGIATAATAARVPGLMSYPAEVATLTTMGAAMEGTVPEPQDFIDAAIIIGGLKASGLVASRLRENYAETGEHPYGVVERIKEDPSLQEKFLSTNFKESVLGETGAIIIEKKPKLEKVKPETPEQRVLEKVETGKEKKPKRTWHDYYTDMVDDFHPLGRVVGEMTKGKKPKAAEDPYTLARLFRGVKGSADHFLEYATFTFNTKKNIGKPLKRILEPLKDDLEGFRAYIVSKRAIELSKRDIESGFDLKDAHEVVKQGRKKYEAAANDLQVYQDQVLRYLRDSGLISKKTFEDIKDLNKDYVPFYRVMDVEGKKGTGKGLEAFGPLKRIKGSERPVYDPLESIIKNTYLFITLAEKNRIGTSLVRLAAKTDGLGKYVVKTKKPVRPIEVKAEEIQKFFEGTEIDADAVTIFRPQAFAPKENQIRVWLDGKENLFEVHPDIARVFKGLDTESQSVLLKILSIPAKWLRAGAILSPEFIARNPIRDQFSAFVFSKYGFVPGLDLIRGIASVAKKDKFYHEWQKSGGMLAELVALDRVYLKKGLGEVIAKYPFLNRIKYGANPIELLRVLSELSEQGTRLGEFKKARKRGATLEEAGFASREVTLDFARVGAKTRAVNSLIAFWNANVQGTDKLVRSFRDRPIPTTAKITAGITVPSILLAIVNHDDPRWQDIPRWQKDLFWIVMTDDHIYRIPKPFEMGIIFGTVPERFVEAILNEDPRAFDDLLKSVGRGAAPGMIPTVAVPPLENWANRSLFLDRPLIPANKENLLPEYQYKAYTTEIAKAIGKLLGKLPPLKENPNIAPVKIENLIRGWSGGLGMHILQLASFGLEKSGAIPSPNRPSKTLSDIPLIKAFHVRYPTAGSENINEFYENYFSAQKRWNTFKYLITKELNAREALKLIVDHEDELVKMDQVYKALSTAHQTIELIHNNPKMDPDEKRQLIDRIYLDMTKIASLGNKALRQIEKQIKEDKKRLLSKE